jgi:hypothetical protein
VILEPISPELVLVCPDLAERARASLPDPHVPELGFEARLESLPEDFAAFVDRMTASLARVERRLAEIERSLERVEARPSELLAPREPRDAADPGRPLTAAVEVPASDDSTPRRRRLHVLSAVLLFVGVLVAVMVILELLPSRAQEPFLQSASEPLTSEQVAGSATGDVGVPEPAVPREPVPIKRPPGVRASSTASDPSDDAPTVARPKRKPDRSQPKPRTRLVAPPVDKPTTTRLEPSRSFAWPAVEGATFYSVRFLRDAKLFYVARVSEPRVELPKSLEFTPGSYRWIVRADTGPPSHDLGGPIVDSTFVVDPS